MAIDKTKVVKCVNCGADVVINANYPITEVLRCAKCPGGLKNDRNL